MQWQYYTRFPREMETYFTVFYISPLYFIDGKCYNVF